MRLTTLMTNLRKCFFSPISICESKNCHVYSNDGLGNEAFVHDMTSCNLISSTEYFCPNPKIPFICPIYNRFTCSATSLITKNTPFKMLNSSHFYLFTNIDTEVLGNTLPAHTNFLVSFKVDTTFTIEEHEIFAKAFPGQFDLLKVVSLKIDDNWFDVLKIWISTYMYEIILSTAVSLFLLTLIGIAVIMFRKKANNPAMVRINNSRVYYRAGTNRAGTL